MKSNILAMGAFLPPKRFITLILVTIFLCFPYYGNTSGCSNRPPKISCRLWNELDPQTRETIMRVENERRKICSNKPPGISCRLWLDPQIREIILKYGIGREPVIPRTHDDLRVDNDESQIYFCMANCAQASSWCNTACRVGDVEGMGECFSDCKYELRACERRCR